MFGPIGRALKIEVDPLALEIEVAGLVLAGSLVGWQASWLADLLAG